MGLSLTRTRRAGLFAIALPAALILGCADRTPTSLLAPPTDVSRDVGIQVNAVRISQVYGGGGNSGATLTNDFIELYNAGGTPVDLSTWSVQYASSTGSSWQRTNLSGTIEPGDYYLIQQAAGVAGTTPLPTPDATGTIAMSATAGKVALMSTQTTITSGTLCPTTAVVDIVGFGSANLTCFEGTGPTATLSNTTAALRKGAGAQDADNNSADFDVGTPNPRNTATIGPPSVASTTPANGATNVPLNANIAITFTKAAAVTGSWFTIACATSGTHTATVSGGPTAWTLDPDVNFTGAELCTVTVLASQVAEQGNPSSVMTANHVFSFTTLDAAACQQSFTPAYQIQGSGAASPITANTVVTTQGIVVGDFEGSSPALRGFFVQDATGDGDATTSDAVFVFNGNNNSVALGDLVRVTGAVQEFQGQTQLGGTVSVQLCGGGSVQPADVTLPVASADFLERYEGMLVRFPQTLYVTEHFQLGRFGQVVMSSGARLPQPTSIALPGAAALAVQAANDLNRIIVDDALQNQNPDPIEFGRGGNPLTASNTLRAGDAATNIVGVLTFTWSGNTASGNAYRVRPVGALGGSVPDFQPANPRPATPPAVGGTLKVAAMNLLNYFNTFSGCTTGVGGGATGCRGASDAAEFARQWQKTVAAITAMNVDVLGVLEMENDGYAPTSAIADLTDRLNTVEGAGTWAYIDADAATGQVNALGTDVIKVGLLYKPAKVTPVGQTAVLNSTAFVNGGDGSPRNRPALAQAFETPGVGRVVVAVNHLKSKGSACDAPDPGDGQGDCAAVRANAANALKAWLATDPTGMVDSDVLIVGDLNAYAKEDAITALTGGGFTDLIASYLGTGAYSYVFDGQWGYIDYALASSSLASQVTGVAEWHINADEPSVLDYLFDFKSANQHTLLYAADQYRVADHDPVIVGLDLTATHLFDFGGFLAPIVAGANTARAGAVIPVKFSLGGDEGLNVLAPGYPVSRPVSCSTWAPTGSATAAITAGQSPLQYDASTDSYTFAWKTDRAWDGSCRELVVKFVDASVHTVRFDFR